MVNLYKCDVEFVKTHLEYLINIYIVASSVEEAEHHICDTLGIQSLKYRNIVLIAKIDGISSPVCQGITIQNYQRHKELLELKQSLDNGTTTFPDKNSVEAYRQKMESIRYTFNPNTPVELTGTKHINFEPKNELKKVGDMDDEDLQKKYSVWGILR